MPAKDKLGTLSVFFSLLACLCLVPATSSAADGRADSFDVKHYSIKLSVIDFAAKSISGSCQVSFQSKIDRLDKISLQLYRLQADSVYAQGVKLNYSYNDSILNVTLSKPLGKGDTSSITIWYGGKASMDPGGWGGFYWSDANGGTAYNLGVGFTVAPHNFGRAWFPCVDNFTDRASYSFYITTLKEHKAFCGGVLKDSLTDGKGHNVWHWELAQEIPAYLASVAVSNYATIYNVYHGVKRDIPVQLGVYHTDSANAVTSFGTLPDALKIFEDHYSPYYFERVGYVGVPFSSGAMEHACNIAYPNYAVQSARETLMAHELSHHWWGDLVTCRNAEHMWLNEGWASYSESLFTEMLYGKQAYTEYVRGNHHTVLRYAHLSDHGYRPIVPIPHDYTYGMHVYQKGADVVHTLRGYMGDSSFFSSISAFLETYKWQDVSTEDLRNFLSKESGTDLTDFFDKWIFKPGFPHFSIDNYHIEERGGKYVFKDLYIGQRLKEAPDLYKNVPMTLSAWDADWKRYDKKVICNGTTLANWELDKKPVVVAINVDGQISDATIHDTRVLNKTGSYTFNNGLLTLKIEDIQDSALVLVNHHFTGPGQVHVEKGIRLSTERYWTIDGIWPEGLKASATFLYDGRSPVNFISGGYLDNALLDRTEDSLVLMYRTHPADSWKIYDTYTKNMLNVNDKVGTITISGLKKGEYALAMKDAAASVNNGIEVEPLANVYPNPAKESITVSWVAGFDPKSVMITDMKGSKVYSNDRLTTQGQSIKISTSGLKPGNYIISLMAGQGKMWSTQVILNK